MTALVCHYALHHLGIPIRLAFYCGAMTGSWFGGILPRPSSPHIAETLWFTDPGADWLFIKPITVKWISFSISWQRLDAKSESTVFRSVTSANDRYGTYLQYRKRNCPLNGIFFLINSALHLQVAATLRSGITKIFMHEVSLPCC